MTNFFSAKNNEKSLNIIGVNVINLTYINEIIQLDINDINADLEEYFFLNIIVSQHIELMNTPNDNCDLKWASLYSLSLIFLTIKNELWLNRLSCIVFDCDGSVLKKNKIKRLDNYMDQMRQDRMVRNERSRDFFDIILSALNPSVDDFRTLLGLCLLNAYADNRCE